VRCQSVGCVGSHAVPLITASADVTLLLHQLCGWLAGGRVIQSRRTDLRRRAPLDSSPSDGLPTDRPTDRPTERTDLPRATRVYFCTSVECVYVTCLLTLKRLNIVCYKLHRIILTFPGGVVRPSHTVFQLLM